MKRSGAVGSVRPGDDLELRPGASAVVAVRLDDGKGVVAVHRPDPATREPGPPVNRRRRIVVRGDFALIEDRLVWVRIAAPMLLDRDGITPAQAPIGRDRHVLSTRRWAQL